MSTWMWIMFVYMVGEALSTVAFVGRKIEITRSMVVLTLITHTTFAIVLFLAATRGVAA